MKKKSARLIIVSNRLPFNLTKAEGKTILKESDGGLVSALKSYFENNPTDGTHSKTIWLGAAEFSEKNWSDLPKETLDDMTYQVEPIFPDKKLYSKFYNGFSNATLWPLFHYFPSFVEFDSETFRCYEEVNKLFLEKIMSFMDIGDTVWIHDYQLMLLPGMIRKRQPDATIGFFLHIPFPSYELFRLLHRPWKEKIVDGLLGADLVGFHTHEYVQHFLKTVQMVRGYDHQFRSVFLRDRQVKAEMFPLGIDFKKFNEATQLPEVVEQERLVRNNFPDKKILFSVDRLDYTKGITHRLAGFEYFLKTYPEWREKIVFILVVVPSRQIISRYNERKKLIEEEIGRINGKYSTLSWQPVIYRYNHLSFHELTALYNVADIALITPLRDGMNLVAKEYIASQKDHGILILSELAGAASELSEAELVNPMDKAEVSQAILRALQMPPDVQRQKIEVLQQRLKDYTVIHWVDDFMKQLEEIKVQQQLQQTKYLSDTLLNNMVRAFESANRRLILLDYDGTLVPFSKRPQDAVPDKSLLALLHRFGNDDKTDVAIISGRDSRFLQKWFGDEPITLISEHGAGIRWKESDWEYFPDIDPSWKALIQPTLEVFSQRSPGSFIEDKPYTLVWHYRNVEAELGFIRSRELLDSLHHLVRNSNLSVIDGNKVIEIRVSGIDKGSVTKKLMTPQAYDFVMAMGDDKTDEDMFKVLGPDAYTIKIGSKHTLAQYYLNSSYEVLALLRAFGERVSQLS